MMRYENVYEDPVLTKLGEEEKRHKNSRDDRDDSARERPLIELLITDLGEGVEALYALWERGE